MTVDPPVVPLRTADFDYALPTELIAQEPVAKRGESRLLVVEPGGELFDRRFADIVEYLAPGDLLVVNTTRVRHARLHAARPSGAPAEILLLHPAGDGRWVAMGRPGSALRAGRRVQLGDGAEIETDEVLEDGNRIVRFVGLDAATAIARFGQLPLPPYIERAPTLDDENRYQTVYAEREGSVAAPTAGLHFTGPLLAALEANGVELARVELEVGPGTFKPVEADDPALHLMHAERYEIGDDAARRIAAARQRGARVWAVGTTVVRTLETAALPDGTVKAGAGETRLLIVPGYRFQVVDGLLTNFHLPRSTLLMLVSAFSGVERIRAAYDHAVRARYRFYSYGDAMLLPRPR